MKLYFWYQSNFTPKQWSASEAEAESVVKLLFILLEADLNLTQVLFWHQALLSTPRGNLVRLQCVSFKATEKIYAISYFWDNINVFLKCFLHILTVLFFIITVQLIEQMLETMTIGCFWDSPKEWKIKARQIFCPADPVIHGSGTAVTSEWSAQYGTF